MKIIDLLKVFVLFILGLVFIKVVASSLGIGRPYSYLGSYPILQDIIKYYILGFIIISLNIFMIYREKRIYKKAAPLLVLSGSMITLVILWFTTALYGDLTGAHCHVFLSSGPCVGGVFMDIYLLSPFFLLTIPLPFFAYKWIEKRKKSNSKNKKRK